MVAPPETDSYVPERGDIVWLQFDPQAGHEQAGHRPALVVSPRAYNGRVGLALFCPLTTQVKGYPFEVPLPVRSTAVGAILADQIKSLDWVARGARKFAQVDEVTMAEVLEKSGVLVGQEGD